MKLLKLLSVGLILGLIAVGLSQRDQVKAAPPPGISSDQASPAASGGHL